MFSLADAEARRGVVTHSSGNHGAALAYAARRRGIAAWVVMPENAPKVKQDNVRRFGATIRFCAPNVAAREAACAAVRRETGATLIHPFDDARVIAGQGTAALELLEAVPELDVVIAPVRRRRPAVGHRDRRRARCGRDPRVWRRARERRRCRAQLPLGAGRAACPATTTIADGLRTTLSPRTLAAIRAHVAAIGTASEDGIVRAMRMTWERMKIVIEPSSAVPLACLLERTLDVAGAARRRDRLRRQRRPRPAALAA